MSSRHISHEVTEETATAEREAYREGPWAEHHTGQHDGKAKP